MVPEGSASGRNSVPLLLALIAGGLAGIYFRYPIFFNLDFVFGSIFSMLALQYLGYRRGLCAALVVSCYLSFLRHHPYLVVIGTAEMAVVGWLVTRRRMELVLADTLYWLVLGIPVIFVSYQYLLHFPPSNVQITMMKQALNGIANALAARLIFAGHALYSRTLTISFREILYNLLALFVLVPALIVLAVGSRADFVETERAIRSSLLSDSRRITSNLDHWLNARKVLALDLAGLAATLSPREMQPRLEQALASDLYLSRIGLHDADAVTVAHAPLLDEAGRSNLGKSFADRPFIQTLKRTLKPMLSELVQGTIDPQRPRVLMLAPVVKNGAYAGYVASVLNLERVRTTLQENADGEGMCYTLLDGNGRVIISNRSGQRMMAPLVRPPGEYQRLEGGISQWIPQPAAGTPIGERWKESIYLKKSSIGNFGEWDLVLEQPVAPYQSMLYSRYAVKLRALLLVFLAALGVAELLSLQMQASFARLRALSSNLPLRVAQQQEIRWMESPVSEVRELVDTLREMTRNLSARYEEVRELNERLELRVAERTRELTDLNRDFLSFLENTSDFIYFKDEASRIRFCSTTLAAITGHAGWRELIGKHDAELFPPELARLYAEEEAPIFQEGSALLNKVDPYYDVRGRRGWVSTNKWPVRDAAGKVVGIFGISRDITELVQVQESLQLARQSLNRIPDPVLWVDRDGIIVDCNEGTCHCLGYSVEELLQSPIFLIDPLVTPENWPAFRDELRSCGVKHFDTRYRGKGGRTLPVDVYVTHLTHGEREIFCGVARDISERTEMEQRLRQSEARLSRAHRMAKLRSWEWEPTTDRITYTDDISADPVLSGKLPETFRSMVEQRVHPEDRQLLFEAAERARETGIGPKVEYRVVLPDGSVHWIRSTGEFLVEEDQPVKLVGVNQDVTERKRVEEGRLELERQMLHLQKLESLGVLCGGIAHDFNNLLQVVLGNLDLSLMLLAEDTGIRKNLEQAVIAAVRASELSGMMLAYSGKGVLAISRLDLSDLVQENAAMLAAVVPKPAVMEIFAAHGLPQVQGDATQLLQVVMNLLRNASEALGEAAGSITIRTGVDFFDQATLAESRVEEKLPEGRYVFMEVEDTGCGMDESTRYKVFDPFFTTKFTGRGLGMSAVLGIMRAHKGAILLKSRPGAGTRVRLLFPSAQEMAELRGELAAPPEPGLSPGSAPRDTILIVDDEEMIRTLTTAMLEAFGLETLAARDGEQALEIFGREGDRISMVLLDQSMPTMDGLSVFKELRRLSPGVKVLLASGYSRDEVSARFTGLSPDGFIQKPFNAKNLWEEVQRVLKRS